MYRERRKGGVLDNVRGGRRVLSTFPRHVMPKAAPAIIAGT
jgi:hypothetical protein